MITTKQRVPKTKVSQKKGWKTVLLGHQEEFMKRLNKHDREVKKQIIEEVHKEIGDKIHMIESALKDVMVQRKIFVDKGFITREEINKKYEELKNRNKHSENTE